MVAGHAGDRGPSHPPFQILSCVRMHWKDTGGRRYASLPILASLLSVRHAWNTVRIIPVHSSGFHARRTCDCNRVVQGQETRLNFRRNIYSAGTMLLTPRYVPELNFVLAMWPKLGFEGLSRPPEEAASKKAVSHVESGFKIVAGNGNAGRKSAASTSHTSVRPRPSTEHRRRARPEPKNPGTRPALVSRLPRACTLHASEM
jgi:hypothetical protein